MNETHVVEESASTLRAVCNRDRIDTCSRMHLNMQKHSTHEYTSAHICSHKYTDTHPTHTCKSISHTLLIPHTHMHTHRSIIHTHTHTHIYMHTHSTCHICTCTCSTHIYIIHVHVDTYCKHICHMHKHTIHVCTVYTNI